MQSIIVGVIYALLFMAGIAFSLAILWFLLGNKHDHSKDR